MKIYWIMIIFDVEVGLVPRSLPAFVVEVEREISGTKTKSFFFYF